MEPTTGWKPLPRTIEAHEADEKRIAETLNQVEAYWHETAPYGGPQFDAGRGMELLLYDARRFAAGLVRIVQKADEQKALMDHKAATGNDGLLISTRPTLRRKFSATHRTTLHPPGN